MTALADVVLPRIRTSAELYRRGAANAHGRQMHEAVDILDEEMTAGDPADVYDVTHRALASALKVIARADDSSGIIGDACRRLIELHPQAAAAAGAPPRRLVDWMMKFQFEGKVDYFELDPVSYADALGATGIEAYRARLDAVRRELGPEPPAREYFRDADSHTRFVLLHNDQRLAVLDGDVEAIVRTHLRDRAVAAWFEDTAEAFEEIGMHDLAIDWARQGTEFDDGWQSQRAGKYWCELLERHRASDEQVAARLEVFKRWPSAGAATALRRAAGDTWGDHSGYVMERLTERPEEAVLFALQEPADAELAWELAWSLDLESAELWSDVAAAYEAIDQLETLRVHQRLAERDLVHADARGYRSAARRLARMRSLADGSVQAEVIDVLIARLREANKHRPRLQLEFDRAGLPER